MFFSLFLNVHLVHLSTNVFRSSVESIVQTVATKRLVVGIEYHAIGTGRYQEAIVGKRAGWREVEDEE